jgi:hypothetical protein
MRMFINEAITNGIEAYKAKSQNQQFSLSHIFEYKVIEYLITLYGKINILNPYQIKDENSFKNNLMIYGADKETINKLINLLNKYNIWLNSSSNSEKNTIISEIFYILSKLSLLKNKVKTLSPSEMEVYQNFLNLKDNKIKQIVEMSAINKEEVLNSWVKAEDDIKKADIPKEPIYLPEDEYKKYGIYPEDLENLPEDKIKKLNKDITDLDDNASSGGRAKNDPPKQLILTSGNGFIDALVLLSIICTEIMIGIVITILIARL